MGGVAPIDRNKRPRIGTDEWYAVEILDTLYTLKNKIRKRDMEAARTLPSFRVMIICAELFEDYRSDVREKLVRSGCTQVELVLAHERNPSLEQLLTFHSVLVWSNAEFHDPGEKETSAFRSLDSAAVRYIPAPDALVPYDGRVARGHSGRRG
jgi:hypothetical protein